MRIETARLFGNIAFLRQHCQLFAPVAVGPEFGVQRSRIFTAERPASAALTRVSQLLGQGCCRGVR
jgi:hypothetical protein